MAQYDVAIVGGGFGGATTARALERLLRGRAERIVLIAPENFLLFSPLLPEAASGTIEPRHAVIPLREMLHRARLVTGTVESIDLAARTIEVRLPSGDHEQIDYRVIVLSPGSVPVTLPIPGLVEHAVGFKTIADAIWLRNRLFTQLEAADACGDRARRRELLTFTVVGGGYAGVEALAEMESLARGALRSYPRLLASDLRWVLVEAQATLLPGLDSRLAAYTESTLRARGVEVHLGTRLRSCVERLVTLDRDDIHPFRSETIVWTAGQRPSPLVTTLGVALDDRGRIVVDEHVGVPSMPGVFAIGDAAAVPDPDGGTCPGTAQHALRQARVAATNAAAALGVGSPVRFRYRNRGLAVTLGKWSGTAQVRSLTFRGFVAWWMGRSYHLLMIPGLARKVRVVTDWTIGLVFPRDVSQLGSLGQPTPLPPPTDTTPAA